MRKNIFYLTIMSLIALFAFNSCQKEPDPTLTVETKDFTAKLEGEEIKIDIKSNTRWVVTTEETWVTLSATSGSKDGSVLATVAANERGERKATINIAAGKLSETVTITQGDGTTLLVDRETIPVTGKGGDKSFNITSSGEWKVVANDDWLSVAETAGDGDAEVVVTVQVNEGAARQGTLTVTAGNNEKTVTIKQMAPAYTIKADEDYAYLLPGSVASSITVPVITDAKSWSAVSNVDWITVTKLATSVKLDITSLDKEWRYGAVILSGEYVAQPAKISVKQKGATITATSASAKYFGDIDASGTAKFELVLGTPNDDGFNSYGVNIVGYATSADFENFSLAGTYTVGSNMSAGTFVPGEMDENGHLVGTYDYGTVYNTLMDSATTTTGGTITITKDGENYTVSLDCTGKDVLSGENTSFKYTYSGPIKMTNYSPREEIVDTFGGSYAFYYGNLWNTGTENWYVNITTNGATYDFENSIQGTGALIRLDMYATLGSGSEYVPNGTYSVLRSEAAGSINSVYSEYMELVDGLVAEKYSIKSGTATFSVADSEYTINFELVTEHNLTLKGEYKGTLLYKDKSQPAQAKYNVNGFIDKVSNFTPANNVKKDQLVHKLNIRK